MAEALLAHAADDVPSAPEVRALLRDLQEVRAAKMRASTRHLDGGGGVLNLRGAGGMELAESRGFVLSVVDGVRKIGASIEASRREEEEARGGADGEGESDDEMEL
jgi:GINS complex subunit 2